MLILMPIFESFLRPLILTNDQFYESSYLVFVPLNALSDRHQSSINVRIETGLVPVGAGEGELGNEGDGREHLLLLLL